MTFASALKTYLASKLGVTLYPLYVPQRAALPAIVYHEVNAERTYNLSTSSQVCVSDYQFVVISQNYIDVTTLSEQLRLALLSYSGSMGTATVQTCQLEHQETNYTESGYASDRGEYQYLNSYRIVYVEP
jgi:hypothetical protein